MSFIQTIEKAAQGKIAANWDKVLDKVVEETGIQAKAEGLPRQIPQFVILL